MAIVQVLIQLIVDKSFTHLAGNGEKRDQPIVIITRGGATLRRHTSDNFHWTGYVDEVILALITADRGPGMTEDDSFRIDSVMWSIPGALLNSRLESWS